MISGVAVILGIVMMGVSPLLLVAGWGCRDRGMVDIGVRLLIAGAVIIALAFLL